MAYKIYKGGGSGIAQLHANGKWFHPVIDEDTDEMVAYKGRFWDTYEEARLDAIEASDTRMHEKASKRRNAIHARHKQT